MKVPAHVFYYTLVFGASTLAAIGIARTFGVSDDEKRKVLVRYVEHSDMIKC